MTKPITVFEWRQAKGLCGFNVKGPVYGAYVKGVALFAFQHTESFWNCVVTGQLSCGGKTLEEAQQKGVYEALKHGLLGSDRRYSRKQFNDLMEATP